VIYTRLTEQERIFELLAGNYELPAVKTELDRF